MMHGRQDLPEGGTDSENQEEVAQSGKVRIYEVARDIGISNNALVSKIRSLGIEVKNHMSSLEVDDVQRVKRALEKERQENLVEERVSATVIRRRSKVPRARATTDTSADVAAPVEASSPMPEPPAKAPAPAQETAAPTQPAGPAETVAPGPAVAAPANDPPAEPGAPQATAEVSAPQTPAPAQPGGPESADTTAAPAPAAPGGEAVASPPGAEKNEGAPEKGTGDPAKAGLRYAPGFKPGMTYGRDGRPHLPNQRPMSRPPRPGVATEEQPISAADALRMLTTPKPRVVITDLDGRRGAGRGGPMMPGRRGMPQNRRFRGRGPRRKRVVSNKKSKKTEITMPAQHKRVIRLQEDMVALGDLAQMMGTKANEALKRLWALGMTDVRPNQAIDFETASLLANDFGYELEDVSFNEDAVIGGEDVSPEDLEPRPPVVTVMGHVDHGKTSLLDAMRDTRVAAGEAGGITQHIGASQIQTPSGRIVFLDTPGHEAFTRMRARGANCTDMVILVVAANDGVMPQTVEALDHAKSAEVPIIVAVNKTDLPDANSDRVRSELADRGLIPEEWGGETIFVDVSAKTGDNLDTLLESLTLQAEMLELKASSKKPAKGMIIESRLDKTRGAMSSVLVQEGTLRVGDMVVTGEHMGKVRAMIDDRGQQLKEAGPCTPVELFGLGGVPEAGDALNVVEDQEAARGLVEHRRGEARKRELGAANAGMSYEQILQSIQSGAAKELKLLVKADVHGSAEAVRDSLVKLSTAKVSTTVISSNVGGISENDINLAKASGAIVLGFSVRPAGKAAQLAEREGVEVRIYDVIYEMLDEVKLMMTGLLPAEQREKALGRAEVRETFTIPKIGVISGCSVLEGKIQRNCQLRLVRDNIKIYEGRVSSLRRFKDDVKEVLHGFECGIGIEGTKNIKVGDIIEAYEIEEIAPTLD